MKTRFERLAELKLMSPQDLDVTFVGALGSFPATPSYMLNEQQLWVRHIAIMNMEGAQGEIHRHDFLCRVCLRPCDSQQIEAGPAYAAYEMFSKHLLCVACAMAMFNWPGMKDLLTVAIDQALTAGALPSK